MNLNPFRLLIIEDNVPDIELFKILFGSCGYSLELHFVKDGVDASDYLHRRCGFETAMIPDLILMDLNIPGKDGKELLQEIKRQPDLCAIPTIVMSTSSSEKEVHECYCLGASSFISKPLDLAELQLLIRKLVDYWFGCVALPKHTAGDVRESHSRRSFINGVLVDNSLGYGKVDSH